MSKLNLPMQYGVCEKGNLESTQVSICEQKDINSTSFQVSGSLD